LGRVIHTQKKAGSSRPCGGRTTRKHSMAQTEEQYSPKSLEIIISTNTTENGGDGK
jgi:hypothetical protein